MGVAHFQGGFFGYPTPENGDTAPVFSALGFALADTRVPFGYQPGNATNGTGFLLGSNIVILDAVPAALAVNNIATTQAAAAGQPLTLTAGAGVTSAPVANNTTGVTTTQLVLDGLPASVATNQNNTAFLRNPATLLARNVRITSAGNDSGGSFLVAGLDLYGFPMSEMITGANAGVASGRKAFKSILSITPAGTLSGANVTVGTGDVYGLPLRADSAFYVTAYWNNAVLAPGTLTPADQTTPATPTTGDVRGTIAVPSASDGTKRLQVLIIPTAANIASAAGLYGQAQA